MKPLMEEAQPLAWPGQMTRSVFLKVFPFFKFMQNYEHFVSTVVFLNGEPLCFDFSLYG
jgi:hypothetical protein